MVKFLDRLGLPVAASLPGSGVPGEVIYFAGTFYGWTGASWTSLNGGGEPTDQQLIDLAALQYTGNAYKYIRVNPTADNFELASLGSAWATTVTAVGTGSSQNIGLPEANLTPKEVLVFVDGIRWNSDEYTISGTTLTLTTNIAGETIEIVKNAAMAAAGITPFSGALVKKSGVQTLANNTTTTITFDEEEYNEGGWHSNATNNSRLTVPSGVTRVRVSARISRSSVTGQIVASLIKNGGASPMGSFQGDTDTAGTDHVTVQSAILTVVPGDYFELQGYFEGGGDVTTDSWFAIEAVTSAPIDILAPASNLEIWSGSGSRALTATNVYTSAAEQPLTDGATITINGSTGLNFAVTLAGNRTLANPTNMKSGQSGVIVVTQDATGSRTLTYGSNWKFAGGAAAGGVLSTTPNAVDVLSYFVRPDGTILATLGKAFAS